MTDKTLVLITGGTGFVGKHVLAELQARGDVDVIATSRQPVLDVGSARWIKHDLDDDLTLEMFSDLPAVLIHLAWGGLPNYQSESHVIEELVRQKRFLDQAIQLGIQDIFVAGTCFEYGLVEGPLSETDHPRPHTKYGVAKNQLRRWLEDKQKHLGFNLTWGRLFYLFGEGQGAKSLYTQFNEAIASGASSFDMSGGEQERDFLNITKAAKLIVDLALLKQDTGVVNVCSGEPISVKSIVSKWLLEKNASMSLNLGVYPYPDYEAMRFWGDSKKLRKILEAA